MTYEANMKTVNAGLCFVISVCLGAGNQLEARESNELGIAISNGQFKVVLPPNGTTNALRMVEWSTNLVNWEPEARD
jgi:hypothetical protein